MTNFALRRAVPVVLVVEPDERRRARLRQALLALLPCFILEAADKHTALAQMRAVAVDLVVLAREAPAPGEPDLVALTTDFARAYLSGTLISTLPMPVDLAATMPAGGPGLAALLHTAQLPDTALSYPVAPSNMIH